MKKCTRLLIFSLLLLLFNSPVCGQAPPTLFSGTGQSVSLSPVIDSMATEAVNKAKAAYEKSGGIVSNAKVIIIMENVNDSSTTLVTKIRSVFGTTIPILGVQLPWADYTPYTIEAIPADSATKSLSIMVLGGSAISVSSATGIANFANGTTADVQLGGHDLATKLHPQQGVNNLMLLMGPMHTPYNEYVVAGMREVYGTIFPQNLKVIGWAGPSWGGIVYDNGVLKTNQILGIMLSGNFKWAFSGINHGVSGWDGISGPDGGDPVVEIPKQFTKITTELGTKPVASFMVIAHPDRALFPAIRTGIEARMGSISMIGQHAGSETGYDTTLGDVIADASHFYLAGIALSNTVNSPSPTNIPTQSIRIADGNNDGHVNGLDYIVWLTHFNIATNGGTQNGDYNNDGHVNGLDYIVWLTHFGT